MSDTSREPYFKRNYSLRFTVTENDPDLQEPYNNPSTFASPNNLASLKRYTRQNTIKTLQNNLYKRHFTRITANEANLKVPEETPQNNKNGMLKFIKDILLKDLAKNDTTGLIRTDSQECLHQTPAKQTNLHGSQLDVNEFNRADESQLAECSCDSSKGES